MIYLNHGATFILDDLVDHKLAKYEDLHLMSTRILVSSQKAKYGQKKAER